MLAGSGISIRLSIPAGTHRWIFLKRSSPGPTGSRELCGLAGEFTHRPVGLLNRGRHPGIARRIAVGNGQKVQVEFVSANPTGPLHVAHGRGAAIGDAVASLLEWMGHGVEREFYINDAGRQIELLGHSVDARLRQARGESAEVPEGGYQGEYVGEVAARIASAEDGAAVRPPAEIGPLVAGLCLEAPALGLHDHDRVGGDVHRRPPAGEGRHG